MRVMAIRDSYFNDGVKITDLAIHKGSVYHVTNKLFDPAEYKFQDTGNHYPKGVWFYELLEQGGWHVEDMFVELSDYNLEDILKQDQHEFETHIN